MSTLERFTHYDPETGERSECHCADAEDSL